MKKLVNLNGAKALSKTEQKAIFGGGGCYPFFHLGSCRFDCSCGYGTAARQPSGASQYCLLNYPAIIFDAAQCGGGGNGGGGWA